MSDVYQHRRPPPPDEPPADEFADLCATVFTGGAGKELLAMMRKLTIERRNSANAPEAMLREFEAVRRFVAELERARDRGLELRSRKAKPTA